MSVESFGKKEDVAGHEYALKIKLVYALKIKLVFRIKTAEH